jgi:hypothetical protein
MSSNLAKLQQARSLAIVAIVSWLIAFGLIFVSDILGLTAAFVAVVCGLLAYLSAMGELGEKKNIIMIVLLFVPIAAFVPLALAAMKSHGSVKDGMVNYAPGLDEGTEFPRAMQNSLGLSQAGVNKQASSGAAPNFMGRTNDVKPELAEPKVAQLNAEREAAEREATEREAAKREAELANERSTERAIARISKAFAILKLANLEAENREVLRPSADSSGNDDAVIRVTYGGFASQYAVDEGKHFTFIGHDELAATGVNVEQLHRKAITNLADLIYTIGMKTEVIGEGAYRVEINSKLEASAILIDRYWDDEFAKLTPNGLVMAVPNQSTCAFCDAKSPYVEELRKLAEQSETMDEPISNMLYRRLNRSWIAF